MNEENKIYCLDTISDEELALRAGTGSRPCFEELVSRYSSRLFYFIRKRIATDEDAEDIVQETFLKVFRAIDRYEPKAKFSTWLYTAAYRQAISHYRASAVRKQKILPEKCDSGPEEAYQKKQESQHLWEQAEKLKSDQYQVLWLKYAEDLSIKDISRVLRKKPVTVRVLLHRARLELARLLDIEDPFNKNETREAAEPPLFVERI
ncbi:MAG: RNA polymerase sigma factor [Candidatus Aminicenantes bacterium]|nr:RNA polymerase sigma factor [Candidatus Aminicenantes bacterium]